MADKLNSTFFTPGIVPDDPAQLPQYLRDLTIQLQAAINSNSKGRYEKTYVAPAKPRDGDMAYADGTYWNPGSGAGLYQFNGTSWASFGISSPASDALLKLSNGQIKFPATQNASSDVNTLDDYEEGTFTPSLSFFTGNAGIVYASQLGSYTKIGNVVTIRARISLSNKGTSTGPASIGNLPFNASSVSIRSGGSVGFVQGFAGSGVPSSVFIEPSQAFCYFFRTADGTFLNDTDFTNSTLVSLQLTYTV